MAINLVVIGYVILYPITVCFTPLAIRSLNNSCGEPLFCPNIMFNEVSFFFWDRHILLNDRYNNNRFISINDSSLKDIFIKVSSLKSGISDDAILFTILYEDSNSDIILLNSIASLF